MSDPRTLAGRELLVRHPDVRSDEVVELELQSRGQGIKDARGRIQRVVDALRGVLTPEQLGAVSAVMTLDPDAIAKLDDDGLRFVLDGLVRMPHPGPDERAAAAEANRAFLDEIM